MFSILACSLDAVPYTQSCNLKKPWCLRCPKCCYVWLGYAAYLPKEKVLATFGTNENVLDATENQEYFFQMLGLGDQVPFECVGQTEEVQLAFALCDAKGMKGKAMDMFKEKVSTRFNSSKDEIVTKFVTVYTTNIYIPDRLASKYLEKLAEFSKTAKKNILQSLEKTSFHD